MGAQLGYTAADWIAHSVSLSAGRYPTKFICFDPEIGEVKRIDICSKQCRTIFELPHLYSICDMVCLRENSSESESIAMLIISKFNRQFCEIFVLLNQLMKRVSR